MTQDTNIVPCIFMLFICLAVIFVLAQTIVESYRHSKEYGCKFDRMEAEFIGLGIFLMAAIAFYPAAYLYQHL